MPTPTLLMLIIIAAILSIHPATPVIHALMLTVHAATLIIHALMLVIHPWMVVIHVALDRAGAGIASVRGVFLLMLKVGLQAGLVSAEEKRSNTPSFSPLA